MRRIAAVVLALVVHSALASDAFDVKGVVLGMSEQDAAAVVGPTFYCDKLAEGFGSSDTLTERICKQRRADPLALEDSFAGVPTTITYWSHEGAIGMISMGALRSGDFDQMVAAMRSKYGDPVITEGSVQNRMGASFPASVAEWKSARGDVIVFQQQSDNPGVRLGIARLAFYSPSYWQALTAHRAAKDASARDDM